MVQTCSVRGCRVNSRREENVHFYQFPSEKSNLTVRKQWLHNVRKSNPDGSEWDPKYYHKVCGKHFKDGRPTPENPVPNLDMGEDIDESLLPPPRRGRPPRSASLTGQTTSDSETKGAESDSVRIESNEESNSSTVSETPRGTPGGQSTPISKSPPSDMAPRSSSRKRKKRVMPDALSDEEVLDEVQEEPETFTIWRARTSMTTNKTESEEPATTVASSRMMRPRRTPAITQPQEAEPEPLPPSKKKRFIMVGDDGDEEEKDAFCWICHKEGTDLGCELCPRGFHLKCLDMNQACPSWVCLECEKVMRAECVDTRSPAMSLLTIDQLCVILRFTCSQMRISGSEPFSQPVDSSTLPLYSDFIANPIDFATLEKNIRRRMYGSTEGFLADVKWMLHNSIVFNGSTNKLTAIARAIVRICKQEISDIEGCPDCYTNAWIKQDKNWFIKPCRIPHTLVWAKLKGYPFWPGKAIIEDGGQTDVRFFGAHDRAWVPTTNVFLLSREPPVEMKNRRMGLEDAMDELNYHIKKLRDKFGSFRYAALNVPYDPNATHSYFGRHGELKPEIKRELGVPVKTELKTEVKDIPGEALKENSESTPLSEVLSNSDVSERVTTPMEDIPMGDTVETEPDLEADVTGASAEVTPTKLQGVGKGILGEHGSPGCPPSKKNVVDLSSVQQADSRGVFEVSAEAFGPDVTKIQRNKLPDERIIRSSPRGMANRTSIVEHLQQKMQEAEMESSDEKDKSGEEKLDEKSRKPPAETPTGNNSGDDREILKTSPKLVRVETNEEVSTTTKDKPPLTSSTVDPHDPSPPILEPELESFKGADTEKLISMEAMSTGGTPKKNPLLANLVESCKAKLGITSEDELKDTAGDDETSPSLEMAEEDRSVSPETVTSSKSDDDEDNEEDDDDDAEEGEEEGEDDDDDDEDYEEEDDDEEDEEDKEEMEKVASSKKIETNQVEERMETEKMETEKTPNEDVGTESVEATKWSDTKKKAHDAMQKHSVENIDQKDDCDKEMEVDAPPAKDPVTTHIDDLADSAAMQVEDRINNVNVNSCSDSRDDGSKTQSVCGESSDSIGESAVISKKTDEQKAKHSKEAAPLDEEGIGVVKQKISSDINEPLPSRLLEVLAKPSPKKNDIDASARVSSLVMSHEVPPIGHGAQTVNKPIEGSLGPGKIIAVKKETPPKDKSVIKSAVETLAIDESEEKTTEAAHTVSREPDVVHTAEDCITCPEARTPMTAASDKLLTLKAMLQKDQSDGDGDAEFNVAKYVNKAMDGVQSVFQQMFDDFISSDMGHKTSKHLKTELERTKWHYEQAMLEQHHNSSLVLAEVRMVLEHDQNVRIKKLIKLHEEELDRIVEDTKSKQWCANCAREAMFYCCWNTSYCDYPCQQRHWAKHMSHCTQSNQTSGNAGNTVPHDVMDATQTTLGKSTEQISRAEGKGMKRSHSEMMSPQPVTVTAPGGIQYLPPQIAGPGGGMVQYITSPIGGTTSASPVALQQLLTNQGVTTTSTGAPIMYQLVPQQQGQVPANIRIINQQTTPNMGAQK